MNPIIKTAAFDELQKEPRNAAQHAHVMAAHNVRKQSQANPRIGGFHKVVGLLLSFKWCLARTLYREVYLPFAMVHPVNQALGAEQNTSLTSYKSRMTSPLSQTAGTPSSRVEIEGDLRSFSNETESDFSF